MTNHYSLQRVLEGGLFGGAARIRSVSFIRWGGRVVAGALVVASSNAMAQDFSFSTGNPDGKMATASRPESNGKIEIESADDFNLTSTVTLNSATFTGLLTGNASLNDI